MLFQQMNHLFVSLLTITNPIGAIPIFISLTRNYTRQATRHTAVLTGISIGVILVTMTWVGLPLLKLFGISIGAFKCAGGLIVLSIGWSMLNSKESQIRTTSEEHEQARGLTSIAVMPLALPLIAGPGAMSTVIVSVSSAEGFGPQIYASIVCLLVALIIGTLLFFASAIGRALGPIGIKLMIRIMGLILVAVALQMLAGGLHGLFPGLAVKTTGL